MQQHVMLSTETSLAPFDHKELSQYIKGAPEVYTELTNRSQKAIEAGHELLDKIKERGMDEELAAEITNFIKKAKSTKELSKQKRTPITQMFQAVSKAFTAIESDIQDMADKLKKVLDDYATEQARLAKVREEEERKKAAAKKELAELEAELEKGLYDSFLSLITKQKTYLNYILDNATLNNIQDVKNELSQFDTALPVKELKWPAVSPLYATEDQIKEIKKTIGQRVAADMKQKYHEEISDAKQELVDNIPSKTAELEEERRLAEEARKAAEEARKAEAKRQEALKKAKEEERAKLEEQQRKEKEAEAKRQAELKKQQEAIEAAKKKREEEEAARLKEEEEKARLAAEASAKARAEAASMNAMFEAEMASGESNVPKGKNAFEIIVNHQQAYAEMFAIWFQKEGGNMPLDKLENVTLGRVKKYCEKLAADGGEKIESKFLKYKEHFVASTR